MRTRRKNTPAAEKFDLRPGLRLWKMQQSVSITSRRSLGLTTSVSGATLTAYPSFQPGLEDVSRMPALTLALMKRGYKEADIQKIMGGNFLRVVKEVVGN